MYILEAISKSNGMRNVTFSPVPKAQGKLDILSLKLLSGFEVSCFELELEIDSLIPVFNPI